MLKILNGILLYFLATGTVLAQSNQAEVPPVQGVAPEIIMNENAWLFGFALVIMLIVIVVMARSIKVLSKALMAKEGIVEKPREEEAGEYKVTAWNKMMQLLTKSVPVAQEEDVMLHHNYDGIRELDNKLPPWWLYGFYITIIFAFVYIYYYHLADSGMLSAAEYNDQMRIAEEQRQQRIANSANYVTEGNVVRLTDDASLAEGSSLYLKNCLACHGDKGQGLVGPNMTDQYWLHGGDIKDIFRVITNGVPANGMISWKSQLSPKQIQQLSSFILTFQGTNPPGAKEPQGTLYIARADSAVKSVDSLTAVNSFPDSTIQSVK
jgi:cytochrome c oxidase cbb3-type subunit III